MNSRYLPLLAIALVFGCSKPASTGNTTSNSTDSKPAVTTSGSTTGTSSTTTTGTTPTPPTSGATTASTTGTVSNPPPGPKAPVTPKTDPKGTPMTAPPHPPTGPAGTASTPPAGPTPEQQKAMQDQIAKQKTAMMANGAKAAKATKAPLDGVKGTYHSFIDESKIPPQAKTQPGYAEQLAKVKAMEVVVANDGSVTLKGFSPVSAKDVTGITSKIDGKPALVVDNPAPKPGTPTKQFVELKVTEGGATIQFGPFTFKR